MVDVGITAAPLAPRTVGRPTVLVLKRDDVVAALEQGWSWDQVSLTEMVTPEVARMMWSRTDL